MQYHNDVQDTIKDKGGTLMAFLYDSVIDTMVVYREDDFTSRPKLMHFLMTFTVSMAL